MLLGKLEDRDPRLKGINLIVGEWCHAALFSSNVYALGKDSITLIDAGDGTDPNIIASELEKFNLNAKNITRVAITHTHDDHWGGLLELLQLTSLTIMVYKADIPYYQKEIDCIVGSNSNTYDILGLEDGDILEAEGHKLVVIHTPGHDKGGISFYDEENRILFSGDTVFSTGTTGSLRSGNVNDMKKTLRRLSEMNIEIMLPGHGELTFQKANKTIKLALERLTWNENLPKDTYYWIRQWPTMKRYYEEK